MPHIVTLTLNPAIDLATSVPEVTPEHKLRCGPVRRDPGGGGINVARVVRELVRVTAPGGRVLVHDDVAAVAAPREDEAVDDDLLELMRRAGDSPR